MAHFRKSQGITCPVMDGKLKDLVNVFIVDDYEIDYEAARRELTINDGSLTNVKEVAWAKSISEALELIEKAHPNVVLLDLSLPDSIELSGFERIRDTYPSLPIVLLTGLDDGAMAPSALS